jgi:hypothetical protein
MADGQSMTVADVVAQVRDGRLEDFEGEAVALVAPELMEAEIGAEIGAGLAQVAPGVRCTHRNGYRPPCPLVSTKFPAYLRVWLVVRRRPETR